MKLFLLLCNGCSQERPFFFSEYILLYRYFIALFVDCWRFSHASLCNKKSMMLTNFYILLYKSLYCKWEHNRYDLNVTQVKLLLRKPLLVIEAELILEIIIFLIYQKLLLLTNCGCAWKSLWKIDKLEWKNGTHKRSLIDLFC